MKKIVIHSTALLLILTFLFNLTGCGGYEIQAENLMDGIKAETVTGKDADDAFLQAQMAFSLEMFQR